VRVHVAVALILMSLHGCSARDDDFVFRGSARLASGTQADRLEVNGLSTLEFAEEYESYDEAESVLSVELELSIGFVERRTTLHPVCRDWLTARGVDVPKLLVEDWGTFVVDDELNVSLNRVACCSAWQNLLVLPPGQPIDEPAVGYNSECSVFRQL
jgi:hypothetical protein